MTLSWIIEKFFRKSRPKISGSSSEKEIQRKSYGNQIEGNGEEHLCSPWADFPEKHSKNVLEEELEKHNKPTLYDVPEFEVSDEFKLVREKLLTGKKIYFCIRRGWYWKNNPYSLAETTEDCRHCCCSYRRICIEC